MSKGATAEKAANGLAAFQLMASLLDMVDQALFVSDRSGRILFTNLHAQDVVNEQGLSLKGDLNLFGDVLHSDLEGILGQLQAGEQEVNLPLDFMEGKSRARIRWLPEPDWIVASLEPSLPEVPADEAEMRQTVQELMQESREITLSESSRRLPSLAGSKIRQKTVFFGDTAAHELKTPLAVMKGYYYLLLTGSLGKISDRQRYILQESKESCDRLVRLVSMFLNYSALESGKLVLQLRENNLSDCVRDLTCRWQDAFQRAKVRLDIFSLHPGLPLFKFDYQKVQQCMANLLDNALKHTPTQGLCHIPRATAFLGNGAFRRRRLLRRNGVVMPPNSQTPC